MKYVCDTNVFDAYQKIDAIEELFLLNAELLMFNETIFQELIDPLGFGNELVSFGLIPVELSDEELILTEEYIGRYLKLSKHDSIALAIAKERNLTLLTGDKNLRKAANVERVSVKGSIGVLDELMDTGKILEERYIDILRRFKKSAKRLRLPVKEIVLRLRIYEKQHE